jgi:hypothetical protein
MRIFRITLYCLVLAVLVLTFASHTQAQATRTFVSGVGNDADPCSRTAPCRTWAGALVKTFTNGEIDALDPGGYGTASITKSITIDGTQGSGFGSTLASGTTGFIINIAAGNVNDPFRSVRLRNLSINGTGASGSIGTRTGIDGVRFLSGSSLIIENTVISDFSQDGLEVAGAVGEANQMNVFLNNVIIRNCSQSGIEMAHNNANGQVVALLNNVQVHSCATGIEGRGRTRIGIKNAAVAHCTQGLDQAGTDNIMNVEDLFVSYASNGVRSIAGSSIRLSNSVVTQNANGLVPNGGTIHSLSGNSIFGNTVNGAFNGGPTPKS